MPDSSFRPLPPSPALLIEENGEKILVVADLHIGWEISLVEKGVHLPSQVSRIQMKLLQLIEEQKPEQIVFLGDIKQSIARISVEEWRSVPDFLETVQKSVRNVTIILGNHDGDLEPLTPRATRIVPAGGAVVGKDVRIGLFHGHAWPFQEVLGCEVLVMGHIHPVVWFRDKMGLWTVRQVWIKAECDQVRLEEAYRKHIKKRARSKARKVLNKREKSEVKARKLIVIPAFNEFVGGVSLNRFDRRLIGPLLSSGSVNIDDAEIYLLDGTYIGELRKVRTYLRG